MPDQQVTADESTKRIKKSYEREFVRDLAFRLERSSGLHVAIEYLLDVIDMARRGELQDLPQR